MIYVSFNALRHFPSVSGPDVRPIVTSHKDLFLIAMRLTNAKVKSNSLTTMKDKFCKALRLPNLPNLNSMMYQTVKFNYKFEIDTV